MARPFLIGVLALAGVSVAISSPACVQAQQVNLQMPMVSASDSFYERNGVGFGFRFPGGFFNQNSFGAAQPQFSNNPGSNANFGFSVGKGPYRANFNFSAGQGSRRSIVSQTPSVTVPNGGSGAIFSGTVRPFVTGVIPVVGNVGPFVPPTGYAATRRYAAPSGPTLYDRYQNYVVKKAAGQLPNTDPPPLTDDEKREVEMTEGLASTAGHGDLSVAEIKRKRELGLLAEEEAAHREIAALVAKAEGARAAGKTGVAKVYLQQAASRSEGALREQILAAIAQLDSDQ